MNLLMAEIAKWPQCAGTRLAKVLTRPWRGGAPGLSRPPPWGPTIGKYFGGGQHPFYESDKSETLGPHYERTIQRQMQLFL